MEELDIEFTRSLRTSAEAYFKLGFNLTGIKDYKKAPYHKWKEFLQRRQKEGEALNHEWYTLTGIGAITGINSLFCLDFDECDQSNIARFLQMLGLPMDYNWVVISGSGKGFHIWFSSFQLENERTKLGGGVVVYQPKEAGLLKQIELRINQHVVLPPSKSQTGQYRFLNPNDLTMRPIELNYDADALGTTID
ncbi:MAG: bifunctional DNA primase/polymerase [Cyclobacteriaceae bacterium]|nr:bifunctional DNA primase/polymerase [Cyclobacteriaceae bacterium]